MKSEYLYSNYLLVRIICKLGTVILNHSVPNKRKRARVPVDFYEDACPAVNALLMLRILEESRFKRQLRSLLSAYGGRKRAARAILCRYRCYEPTNRVGLARYWRSTTPTFPSFEGRNHYKNVRVDNRICSGLYEMKLPRCMGL